ncbi:MAG TPA: hypothetical protein VLL52_23790, partial [Anaerolineae bacterium]|nr:hypothetical protein [Anaerolineae bacterium]
TALPYHQITLQLHDQTDHVAWQTTLPFEPPTINRWRDPHLFRLPPFLENGRYHWHLTLCPTCPLMPLNTLDITAPNRNYTLPPLTHPLTNTLFADTITLHGATITTTDQLTIDLIWETNTILTTSYRVFIHLLGPDNNILAQSDAEPANWTRPTTSWTPTEIIIDQHTIPLPNPPPTTFTLRLGLYNPTTNHRLPLPTNQDHLILPP